MMGRLSGAVYLVLVALLLALVSSLFEKVDGAAAAAASFANSRIGGQAPTSSTAPTRRPPPPRYDTTEKAGVTNHGARRTAATNLFLTIQRDDSNTLDSKRSSLIYPQQPPHSGRHFYPSHPAWQRRRRRRPRFMEGWYYRLTLPEHSASFAFIVSIEDPGRHPPSDLRLACIQVVGPDDGYVVQADRDDTKFWAWKYVQGIGCIFSYRTDPDGTNETLRRQTYLEPSELEQSVESGFQIVVPCNSWGRIRGHDGTLGGVHPGQGVPGSCDFNFTVQPVSGWGGKHRHQQKSTGGWLASYRVFEPHWQVTMADGRATGTVIWNNRTYSFVDAPFYAEKNWGAALPKKWYWTQCNSFDGYKELSVTAGGGIRYIPFGRQEKLGMISIHYNGTLFEGVPWSGTMEWRVKWGYWELRGKFTDGDHPFEAVVVYACDPVKVPGLVFRAPTPDEGMVYFCRDTFDAHVNLTLWELQWDAARKEHVRKPGPPLIDGAVSSQGGAEIGGGPWWDEWKGTSQVKQPIKALLRLPMKITSIVQGLNKQ